MDKSEILADLFESIDEKIFTPEMKENLQKIFEESVDEKANQKAIELLDSKIEEKTQEIQEEYNKKLEEELTKLADTTQNYLDLVVEEYIASNEELFENSVKSKKVDALLEAFTSMILTTGIDVKAISEGVESKLDESVKAELEELKSLKEEVNNLVNENIALKNVNSELLKTSVINELTEGLSLSEKERVSKLAELVEFDSKAYADSILKISDIIESVTGSKISDLDSKSSDGEIDESVDNTKDSQLSYKSFI